MIHFERSFDYELIRRILTHERIWPHISDDGSPPADQYRPFESELIWYVIVRDIYPDVGPEEILGLWMFTPHNAVCWEVHTALLPEAWGGRAHQAARLMADWIWRNTPCRRIVTNVPENNRLALRFAQAAGMEVYGCNEKSFLKGGKLLDQILLGMSKPAEMAHIDEGSPVAAMATGEEG